MFYFSALLVRRQVSLETSASLSSLASDTAFYTFLFVKPRPQRHNAIPLKEMELSDWLGILATSNMCHLVDVVRYKRVQKGRTCSISTLTVSGNTCKYLSLHLRWLVGVTPALPRLRVYATPGVCVPAK